MSDFRLCVAKYVVKLRCNVEIASVLSKDVSERYDDCCLTELPRFIYSSPHADAVESCMNHLFPCGFSRRESIWNMGAGFAGTALASMLANDGFFTSAGAAESTEAANTLAERAGQRSVTAKSCIFLIMNGAPSQVDTFDFKPELQKHAGQQMPRNKKFINSGGRKIGYLTPNWRRFLPGGESGASSV